MGYAYQILMGRMLSPAEYGLLSALVALLVIVPVPLGAATLILTRKFAEYSSRGDAGRISHLWQWAYRGIAASCVLFLVVFVPVTSALGEYLNVPDTTSIVLLGLGILISFAGVAESALIQAKQAFAWYGGAVTFATLVKILLSVCLVWLGYGINGALTALCATGLVMWAGFYFGARRYRRATPTVDSHKFKLNDVLPILAATIAFTVMTQLDLVLVRHYFSSHDAGIYAAAATLGKSVLYLPAAITMVLFSMVAEKHSRNEHSTDLLIQAVTLVGLLSGGAAVFFLVTAKWLILFFYGPAYVESAAILQYFGFAMLPMALVMVAEHFLLARGQILFVYLFVLIAPLQITAVHFFHHDLLDVVIVTVVSGCVLMVSGYAALWFKRPVRPDRLART